jgi:hypothetical protein
MILPYIKQVEKNRVVAIATGCFLATHKGGYYGKLLK